MIVIVPTCACIGLHIYTTVIFQSTDLRPDHIWLLLSRYCLVHVHTYVCTDGIAQCEFEYTLQH